MAISVGLADSINPSTVGPAMYLATITHAVWRVTQFTVGIFVMNFVAGIEYQRFAGDGVGDDRAIALQQSNRQREMKKVLRRLRRRGVRHTCQYNIRWQIACGGSRILRGSQC